MNEPASDEREAKEPASDDQPAAPATVDEPFGLAAAPEPRSEPRRPPPGAKRARRWSPTLFVVKYLLLPAIVTGSLVALGAHLGANGPDAWYTRAVLWIAGQL